jgi:hypothetical protein
MQNFQKLVKFQITPMPSKIECLDWIVDCSSVDFGALKNDARKMKEELENKKKKEE